LLCRQEFLPDEFLSKVLGGNTLHHKNQKPLQIEFVGVFAILI
jgi:hypothetical protein